MRQPRFLYFDLGNVLLFFDHHQAARQMAEVAGLDTQRVWDLVFAGDLEFRYESGEFDDRGFYEIFCQQTDTRADYDALLRAGSEIFRPNLSIFPVIAALDSAGYRLGVLSNTCPSHWTYCTASYTLVARAFDVHALSCELKACKPSPKVYAGAARLAGVPPESIFFTDDNADNVAGASAAGFDAVQYTSTPALVAELRERGLEFNY
jgi:putative hydrolase of the HAD superfamily